MTGQRYKYIIVILYRSHRLSDLQGKAGADKELIEHINKLDS